MQIIKFISGFSNNDGIEHLIHYILRDMGELNPYYDQAIIPKGVGGVDAACWDAELAIEQFNLLHYAKQDIGGKQCIHMILIVDDTCNNFLIVQQIAEMVSFYLSDYQHIYKVHTDTVSKGGYLHIHFAINTVSFYRDKKVDEYEIGNLVRKRLKQWGYGDWTCRYKDAGNW